MIHHLAQGAYLTAAVLFIFSLYWMNSPVTARRSVAAGVGAMLLAVIATWLQPEIINHGWIVLAIIAGFVVGIPLSRVPLTAVPQRTALSHAFGGLAAGLVGTAKFYLWSSEGPEQLTAFRMGAIVVEIILGFLTFTGSLMAAGKLQELKWIPQRPVTYPLQNVSNITLLAIGWPRVPGHHWDGSSVWGAADHPHWRCRHANCHFHPELICRTLGSSNGLRP
jgi:NAD(P) transhydrogenase subunit beta